MLISSYERVGITSSFLTGGLCCNFQPCDAADVQHSETQEKEDSINELSDCNNGMYYAELQQCIVLVMDI